MAKKKSVKKKKVVRKKTVARKKVSRKTKRVPQTSKYGSKLAIRDLIIFALLSLISYMLSTVSGNELFEDVLYLLAIVFGFLAIAFLIIFLIIAFSGGKVKKKRR